MNKKENGTKQSVGGLKEIREIILGEALNSIQKQLDDLKGENKTLKNHLKQNENNITNAVNKIEELGSKTSNSVSEQKKTNDTIEALKKDFDKKLNELKISKIGKNQIGQAFIEWGMKVKQEDNS
jgi:UbiD family decarboxylase